MTATRKSIAVLMTCHNRREKTVACIASLQSAAAELQDRYRYIIYLTDDGSTDRTADAVQAIEPDARLITGSGALFWNGGMRAAFAAAMRDDHDFYLWLNDDVSLERDGLARMIATYEQKAEDGAEPIVVGAMRDNGRGTSYGGIAPRTGWRRTAFERLAPGPEAIRCDTFNGNCVLIPASVAARLGNLDARFTHAMGDLDYGLRATRAGIPIWMAPEHVGICVVDHVVAGSFRDTSLSLSRRWAKLTSSKGLPPFAWAAFCRRHAGLAWPFFWAWPYARTVASSFRVGGRNIR